MCEKLGWAKSSGCHAEGPNFGKGLHSGVGRLNFRASPGPDMVGGGAGRLCTPRLVGGSLPGKRGEISQYSRHHQGWKRGTPGESGSDWPETSQLPLLASRRWPWRLMPRTCGLPVSGGSLPPPWLGLR